MKIIEWNIARHETDHNIQTSRSLRHSSEKPTSVSLCGCYLLRQPWNGMSSGRRVSAPQEYVLEQADSHCFQKPHSQDIGTPYLGSCVINSNCYFGGGLTGNICPCRFNS